MKYDPIIIEREGKFLEFYFDRHGNKHWFYEIHGVRNREDIMDWDEHLSRKMWYTPEVRERALSMMEDLIK